MEYDNNNTGAIFKNSSDHMELVGTGSLNDEGDDKRIAMIKDVMPDGTTIRDVYVKIGRLWDNSSDKPNAPQFTGLAEISSGEKRVAAWVKQTEKGNILSLKLTDKIQNANHTQSSVDKTLGSDDIPF
tara:strand:+ start:2107 stop:2490 length:384 start_codon:yes stop_codon:yes gene_type:complete